MLLKEIGGMWVVVGKQEVCVQATVASRIPQGAHEARQTCGVGISKQRQTVELQSTFTFDRRAFTLSCFNPPPAPSSEGVIVLYYRTHCRGYGSGEI
jgi:hypothetical protein